MSCHTRLRLCAVFALCLTLLATGCAGVGKRRAVVRALAPETMTPEQWSRVVGVYIGPVRATTIRFGDEGVTVLQTRIEISGRPEAPEIFLKVQTSFSGAWIPYSEKLETFTNIPERRYGTQGYIFASSHDPNQILLRLRPNGIPLGVRPRLILSFHAHGCADVEYLGPSGWRGEGTLHRVPVFAGACPPL